MTLQDFQSTIKYNPEMLAAFIAANNIDLDSAMEKARKEYNKRLAMPKETGSKPVKISSKTFKSRSIAQKKAAINIKDRMVTAKEDMIRHIVVLIKSGEITYHQFVSDPTVYFDSQIMGVYYNNYIIRKAVISYFDKEFIPF